MKKQIFKTLLAAIAAAAAAPAFAEPKVLISEFTTKGSDCYIEVVCVGEAGESIDISSLYVSFNYSPSGKIKHLGDEPITLYTEDRANTAFDDRFAVIHVKTDGITETDEAGDCNGNGVRDIYAEKATQLFNTSGFVVIYDDKNCMIDFAAYSDSMSKFNSNLAPKAIAALNANPGQWTAVDEKNVAASCIDIGKNGLEAYMSVCRNGQDTNTRDDFVVTNFSTPGAENILTSPIKESLLFKFTDKTIPSSKSAGVANVKLFVTQICSLRLRVFSSTGRLVYESQLYKDIFPGKYILRWEGKTFAGAKAGLYTAVVESTGGSVRGSVTRTAFIILGR